MVYIPATWVILYHLQYHLWREAGNSYWHKRTVTVSNPADPQIAPEARKPRRPRCPTFIPPPSLLCTTGKQRTGGGGGGGKQRWELWLKPLWGKRILEIHPFSTKTWYTMIMGGSGSFFERKKRFRSWLYTHWITDSGCSSPLLGVEYG